MSKNTITALLLTVTGLLNIILYYSTYNIEYLLVGNAWLMYSIHFSTRGGK